MQSPPLTPFELSCTPEEFLGVQECLRQRLASAYDAYCSAVGASVPWRVTAGRRTLRQQAEEMSAMTPDQLRKLYCTGGIPSYVEELIAAVPLTPETAYRILCNRSEGYISKHLCGAAIDLSIREIHDCHAFEKTLTNAGLRLLNETRVGIPCYHIYDPTLAPVVVRS